MTEEEAFLAKESIISEIESLVGKSSYTLEEIIAEIEDQLVHLVP